MWFSCYNLYFAYLATNLNASIMYISVCHYLMMLLQFRLRIIDQRDDPWVVKWEWCRRKQLCLTKAVSSHVSGGTDKNYTALHNSMQNHSPGQDSHEAPPKHNSEVLLLHQPAQQMWVLDKVINHGKFSRTVPEIRHKSQTNFVPISFPFFYLFCFILPS